MSQWVMNTILTGLKWQICLVYLDVEGVLCSIFQAHLQRLTMMLGAIIKAGFSQQAEKFRFEYHELKFLGHVVSAAGVGPDPEK